MNTSASKQNRPTIAIAIALLTQRREVAMRNSMMKTIKEASVMLKEASIAATCRRRLGSFVDNNSTLRAGY